MTAYRANLDRLCDRQGYSRSGVGLAAGKNKNYVSDIINGKITPTIDALESLAKVLNASLADVLFDGASSPATRELFEKLTSLDQTQRKTVEALVDTLMELPARSAADD